MSLAANLGLAPRVASVANIDLAALFSNACRGTVPPAFAGIGSRETPADVCADMALIANALERRGFVLRSGGAGGADTAFEDGVSSDNAKQIFIPWRGFNGSASPHYPPSVSDAALAQAISELRPHFVVSDFDTAGFSAAQITACAYLVAEASHPAWDRCSSGAKKLHTRNVHQVLGMKLDAPCRFVVCWTKDGGPTGGTGQAIRIANARRIPVLNLHDASLRRAIIAHLA